MFEVLVINNIVSVQFYFSYLCIAVQLISTLDNLQNILYKTPSAEPSDVTSLLMLSRVKRK